MINLFCYRRLVRGFLKHELKDIEGYDKLDAFLAEDFPRDIKSLAIYLWMTGNVMKQAGAMILDDKPKKPILRQLRNRAMGTCKRNAL